MMPSPEQYPLEETLERIHSAILACGYDPAKQFASYILSEDPTYIPDYNNARGYIPDYNNARGLIRHIDRDDLLRFLIRYYFDSRTGG